MSTPLFFPPASLVRKIDVRGSRTVRELLALAGAECRASGPWTERRVVLAPGEIGIAREPGEWGTVRIGTPANLGPVGRARFAVCALAYGIGDLVCRESIRGRPWTRPRPPRGRPRSGTARSNRERQRAHRERR